MISLTDHSMGYKWVEKAERCKIANTRKPHARIWNTNSVSSRSNKIPCCIFWSCCNLWNNRTKMCQWGSFFFPSHIMKSHCFLLDSVNLLFHSWQWVPEIPQLISQATFSSDGHILYSILVDGTVTIFDATNFEVHCRICTSSYLPPISRYLILDFKFLTFSYYR